MRASNLLRDAGLLCHADGVDVDHLRYSGTTRRRANRFAALQIRSLGAASGPGIYAARLVCLDLIRPSEVESALAADPYCLGGMACIEWTTGGGRRTDRRALSCFTTLSMPARPAAIGDELAALYTLLRAMPEYGNLPDTDLLLELERDLACWAAHRLPRPLWAHVTGLRPMTALPRQHLALDEVQGVPRLSLDERSVARRAEAADMLDTAIAGARHAVEPLLVELATAVFTLKSGESDSETLERWARELLSLRARVESGDVASATVIAWQLDLVESGTLTAVDAAIGTRARYARVASLRLWKMLASMPPDPRRWKTEELSAGYLACMVDPSCRDTKKLGAAIASFQGFLQEVFSLPALPLGLHKLIPESASRAQWVPASAIRRAIKWLDDDQLGDPRLKQICSLMILLAYAAPLRLAELRWLRLRNIAHLPDGCIEIEITARLGASRLKSAAAKRRVLISDPTTVARLKAQEEQREAEGATLDALLFAAAGADSTPYREHAVHVALLRVLKLATGDPEMTFHALRHTCISNAVELLLATSPLWNGNRLTQLADAVGHEVAVTTIEFYSHRFEFSLRQRIDANLREHELGNLDGARSLGAKANTLTVAAKRAVVPLVTHLWSVAHRAAEQRILQLPRAAEGLELHEPAAPTFVGPLNRSFTVFHCFSALGQLLSVDRSLIRDRMHLSESNLASIDHAALQVVRAIYAERKRLPPDGLVDAATALRHLGIELERAAQPRYSVFCESLALPLDAVAAKDAADAWARSWWDGELSADPPERLVPVLKFLHSLGISAQSLLLTYEDDGSDPDGVRQLLESAALVATSVFHDHLSTLPLPRARRGRKRAFLVWPSGEHVAQAGRSNAGFDALMFALAVWAHPEVQAWQ